MAEKQKTERKADGEPEVVVQQNSTAKKRSVKKSAAQPERTQTLEEALAALQEVVGKMDREELGLEEAFQLYQDGMRLLRYCDEAVDRVEKELIVLEEGENDRV